MKVVVYRDRDGFYRYRMELRPGVTSKDGYALQRDAVLAARDAIEALLGDMAEMLVVYCEQRAAELVTIEHESSYTEVVHGVPVERVEDEPP